MGRRRVPWRYIGKARFEHALDGVEHRDQIEVEYRSFELDPRLDGTTIEPVEQMLRSKFGPQGPKVDHQVAELALVVGLDTHGVGRILDDPTAYIAAVRADEQRATHPETTSSPFFLMTGGAPSSVASPPTRSPEHCARVCGDQACDQPAQAATWVLTGSPHGSV